MAEIVGLVLAVVAVIAAFVLGKRRGVVGSPAVKNVKRQGQQRVETVRQSARARQQAAEDKARQDAINATSSESLADFLNQRTGANRRDP